MIDTLFAFTPKRLAVPGWIRTGVGLIILGIVLGFFANSAGQSLEMVRRAWQPVSWFYLVLSFILLILCLLVMALLWYGLLRIMGGNLSLFTAIRFYGLTLLPRYVPGLVWGYAGRTLLCERAGVPRRVAAGSSVVEVGFVVGSGLMVATMTYLATGWLVLVFAPSLILLMGLAFAWTTHRQLWRARIARAAVWYSLALGYIGFWLLYGASSWLIVLSVAPGLAFSRAPEIIVCAAVAWLAGFVVVFVPGGLGVREGVLALTLTPILGPAAGLFVPLVARLIAMISEVTVASLAALPMAVAEKTSTASK